MKNIFTTFKAVRTIFPLLLIGFLLLFNSTILAQLSGTKTIPGDFATIQSAVDSLNQVGVGAGGVTFNVTAGHTELITSDIILTASGTAGNTITFQKTGVGANPLITRTDGGTVSTSTIGGAGDAIIRLEGSDYVTFDGIDVTALDQGIEYGYLTHKTSGTDGCQFVTIENAVITMSKGTSGYVSGIYVGNGTTSPSSAVGVTVTEASGMNSNVTIIGNTIQNSHAGILVRGSSAYQDSVITIGQSAAGNIIQNFGGGSSSTTYGVYFIYVENPAVAYNTIDNAGGGGTPHGSILYGVFYSTVSGDVVGSNNAMTLANGSSSSATYFFYNSNTCTSETFENNTFAANGTYGSGSMYFLYLSNATPNKTVTGNTTVGTFDRTGGLTYCYYNAGSPSSGLETVANNTFSNINISGGSSTFYGIYSNTAAGQSRLMYGNTLSNVNNASTGTFYGIYAIASGNSEVYNNKLFDITSGSSIYGLYAGGTNMVYNNEVYGITSTTTTSGVIYGAYSTTATDITWFNNFLSDLKAPDGTSTTASTFGFYITSGTAVKLYYNTVYLDYTSNAAANNSACVYLSSTPTSIEMRNNIFVNNVDNTVGNRVMAIRRSSTTISNLSASSNNNLYYAGTPSATHLIFYDGTNSDSTLADYQLRVAPADAQAITENPPFINTATTPYDLHISSVTPTQIESGGAPIAGITEDFDGDTRNASTPDIGADEFNGIAADLTAPIISYISLPNTSSTSARSLTSAITDASGIPTAGIGLPVLYWKINSSGIWTAATATFLSGNDYQFNFGSGVVINDTVYYYICAQDNATPPNVGAFPSGGAGGFTPNPPAASTPPTTPSSYIITNTALNGDYTVGISAFNQATGLNLSLQKFTRRVVKEVEVTEYFIEQPGVKSDKPAEIMRIKPLKTELREFEEEYWALVQNGKIYEGSLIYNPVQNPGDGYRAVYATITEAVADLNLRGVSGPVRFLLIDTLYNEAGTITVHITNENNTTATNTVTIKPSTGVVTTVTANSTSPVFVIDDNYIMIDGSNTVAGTTRDMTITNSGTATTSGVGFVNNGTGVVFKNIIGMASGPTVAYGVVFSGCVDGIFDNNEIKKTALGFQAQSSSDNMVITNNDIGSSVAGDHIQNLGISVLSSTNTTITGNRVIGMNRPSGGNLSGILFAVQTGGISPVGATISQNVIRDIKMTGYNGAAYAAYGIRLSSNAVDADVLVSNNMISDIFSESDGSSTGISYTPHGIYVEQGGGYQIYYNSVNLFGQLTDPDATAVRSGAITINAGVNVGDLDIRDNILSNSQTMLVPGASKKSYAIYSGVPNTAFTLIDYNDYNSTGPDAAFGYLGGDQLDLNAWRTATGQDVNSLAVDPHFISDIDLHINTAFNSVGDKGVVIASVPLDFDGDSRSATTPDIGADEYIFVPPSVADPTNVTATSINESQIDVAFTPNANNNNVVIVYNLTGTFTIPAGPPPAVGDPFAGGTLLAVTLTSPYNHTGLTQNTHYYYKLFSYDGSDYSPGVTADAITLISPMSGDYTVGLSLFKSLTGKDIIFEKRERTVVIDEIVNEAYVNPENWEVSTAVDINFDGAPVNQNEKSLTGNTESKNDAQNDFGGSTNTIVKEPLKDVRITKTVTQEYFVPIVNGKEYEGLLYHQYTPQDKIDNKLEGRGVYATITDAINDLNLRGVSGAVRFILVDATYPSETFPIVIDSVAGGSSTNTVTIQPASGVTATVAGSLAQPLFDLNHASYIIFDGRQNGVGNTNSLNISNASTSTSAVCIRLINGSTNNVIEYVNLTGMPSTSTTRVIEFSSSASQPSGNSDNLVTNCDINGGRYGVYFLGTTANPNMNNVIQYSKVYDATFANFYFSSNAANTTLQYNEIYTTVPQSNANYGVNLLTSAAAGVNNFIGNKFYDLQNTSTSTVRGISGTPAAGSTINIINNFFSLTQDNGTKTSIYAIQISGTTEHTANIFYNNIRLGGTHTGGTANVIVSAGIVKSNTGSTATFNAKDNISINNRTGGTSGVFHTNFFVGGTALVGTLDIDYNVWFADGGAGAYHSGWNGYLFNDIVAYRDSAAPHEHHTIFKNVDYISNVDLHLTGSSLGDADLGGTPIAGITVDIDGDTRSATLPYRGADEGNVPLVLINAPTNLTADVDTFTVTLFWQDNSLNEDGFVIERKDGDSTSILPFVAIDSVLANITTYDDNTVNPNTTYTYRVYAYNPQGVSDYSNIVEVTTPIPVELTSFTADINGREILINWSTATETNNRGFDIERKLNGEWEKIAYKEGKGTTTEPADYSYTDNFEYKSYKGIITYRLKQMDYDGTYEYSNEIEVDADFTPKEYTLYQNYPNPFNPVTTIKYSLPFDSKVRIAVYSILGELLGVVVDDVKQVGFHDFVWNAGNFASGMYIYTIDAKSLTGNKTYRAVKKMMLMK